MPKGRRQHETQKVEATLREWLNAKLVIDTMLTTPFDFSNRKRHSEQVDLSRRLLRIASVVTVAYEESGADATRSKHLRDGGKQDGQGLFFDNPEAEIACNREINKIYDETVELDIPVIKADEIDGTDDFGGPLTDRIIHGQRAAIDFLLTYPDAGGDE